MSKKETKDYMKEDKKTMQQPPADKEGLEEPKIKGYKPLQVAGIIIMIVFVIIVILGVAFDMFGLFNN